MSGALIDAKPCLFAVFYVKSPLLLTQPCRVVPLVGYERTSVHFQDPAGDVIQEISNDRKMGRGGVEGANSKSFNYIAQTNQQTKNYPFMIS